MKNVISYCKRKSKILVSRYFEDIIYKFEKNRIKRIFKSNSSVVLIYSLGKVGSSSIYNSIKASKEIQIPVFHIHSLNEDRLEKQKLYYKSSSRKSVPFHLIQSTAIVEELMSYRGEVLIFNLMREPVAREMSSIFQDSFNFSNSFKAKDDKLLRVVKSKFKNMVENLPENEWYEMELKTVFGIDIFDLPFDMEIGYEIKKINNIKFCLIRLENLNDNFTKIMCQMFKKGESVSLVVKNEAKNKFYNEGYKKLIGQLSVSEVELNNIINTPFVTKFYKDMVPDIKSKWLRN